MSADRHHSRPTRGSEDFPRRKRSAADSSTTSARACRRTIRPWCRLWRSRMRCRRGDHQRLDPWGEDFRRAGPVHGAVHIRERSGGGAGGRHVGGENQWHRPGRRRRRTRDLREPDDCDADRHSHARPGLAAAHRRKCPGGLMDAGTREMMRCGRVRPSEGYARDLRPENYVVLRRGGGQRSPDW